MQMVSEGGRERVVEREVIESNMEWKEEDMVWTALGPNKQTNKQRQKTNATFSDQCGVFNKEE